jgi:predicted nucleic acid-binding protein
VRVILDTSVLLGPPPELGDAEVAISAISLAELHFGVLVARTPELRAERVRRLGAIENAFDALPVDDAVARDYGQLAAAVVAAGRQPRARVADLLIAATARTHGAQLWTRNGDDFVGLESLMTVRALTN